MIKTSVMLMNANGPDGNQRDWVKQLEFWKTLGLEGVDIFHVMLNRYNIPLKDMKATLDNWAWRRLSTPSPLTWIPRPRSSCQIPGHSQKGHRSLQIPGVDHLFSHGGQHTTRARKLLQAMDGSSGRHLRRQYPVFDCAAGKMCNSGESLARALKESTPK